MNHEPIQKLLRFPSLVILAAATLTAQPTNGPVYWSATQPDCSSLGSFFQSPVSITNSAGTVVGYSCRVHGTFVWLAAGGEWGTSIRLAAPASAPVGIVYGFFDTNGNSLNLDTTATGSFSVSSGNDVNFALSANQPMEVDLLGAAGDGPGYPSTATGSVHVWIYCPDATTCGNVLPQLIYSALPTTPWSLTVPITWNDSFSNQWSAVGIDDGDAHRVSVVVYNGSTATAPFNLDVYDGSGNLVATGATPALAPLNADTGGGGTYGVLLSDIIPTPLPAGVFKVLIDGGPNLSAVEVLQVDGASATTLQVAYDSAPNSVAALAPHAKCSRPRAAAPKRIFAPLTK